MFLASKDLPEKANLKPWISYTGQDTFAWNPAAVSHSVSPPMGVSVTSVRPAAGL